VYGTEIAGRLEARRRMTRRRPARGPARRAAVAQFALSSLALLVLVAAIGAVTLRHLATNEALSDARAVTVAFSHGVLRREVTPGVLDGDPAALAELDRTVRETVLGRPIVRVKVWTPQGEIVYSDARALIGRRYPLPRDLRGALADDAVRADVSDLSRPENRLERGDGRLVEVYLPLRLVSGRRVLVEAYHPAGQIDAASHRIWRTFLPMLLALLVALAAAQLPLAWSQSRRARAEAREREALAREAERALQDERGRIATELHEGVVQDLAGAAYELHAAATLPAAAEEDLRRALGHGADVCRRTMTRMRDLLVDLRAEEDRVQDLHSALEAIARPLEDAGVEVILGVALERPLPGDVALLVHRAAREILLDVRRRRDVSLVTLKLAERGAEVTLSVDHNVIRGAAGDTADGRGRRPRLDSLAGALDARGGALAVDEIPGVGARYTATLPRD
jgi:two-component system, NarL family, sensor kinase